MRKLNYLYFVFLLQGCIVWDLTPSYSSTWNENIWTHKKTKEPLSNKIHIECREESLLPFETENLYGLESPIYDIDKIRTKELYASCLKNNGFIFSPSFKYCYKFKEICNDYKKYRN